MDITLGFGPSVSGSSPGKGTLQKKYQNKKTPSMWRFFVYKIFCTFNIVKILNQAKYFIKK